MEKMARSKILDDFSETLKPISDGMWEYQKSSTNGCLISEASLNEMLFYLSNVTFGLTSPFIPQDKVRNNVERLASFRTSIQDARIPLYHIIGKWIENESDTYTLDKGYILIKPDHMGKERFFEFLLEGIRDYGQDAFVIKSPDEDLLCVDREGKVIQRYSSGYLSINLLAKAYAYRLPMEKMFSFIGAEIPNGSIGSFQLLNGSRVKYYLPEGFFDRKKVK